MALLLPETCIGLLACASGAPSIEAAVASKAIVREGRRETIIVNLHLDVLASGVFDVLAASKEVDRGVAAIQRDDQIVLIAGCDRMRKEFAAGQQRQASTSEVSVQWLRYKVSSAGAVCLRGTACDAGHQRGLGLAHMPLLVTQSIERTLRQFAFELE
jgi:hypothetical protein